MEFASRQTPSAATVDHLTVSGAGRDGIVILTPVASLSDSVSHHNAGVGMILTTGIATVVENNVVYANAGDGMQISNYNPAVTMRVGNADLSLARGNRVFDNAGHGIVASGTGARGRKRGVRTIRARTFWSLDQWRAEQ